MTMGTVLASHWSGAAAQQPMRGRDVPELSCLVIWAGSVAGWMCGSAAMTTDSSDAIFRPWDSAAASPDRKPGLGSAEAAPRPALNNNRAARHGRGRGVRVKTEPGQELEARHAGDTGTPGQLHPLDIAMRGLVTRPEHVTQLLHVSRVHHQLEQLQLAVSAAVREERRAVRPKKYRCEECGACFSNNGQLRGHVRIHTGERPYACPHPGCGKTFTRNEELTRHKRIHTGLKPFSCPLAGCGKPFGRKDHLKKHMKTHERFCHAPYLALPRPPLPLLPHPASLAHLAQAAHWH